MEEFCKEHCLTRIHLKENFRDIVIENKAKVEGLENSVIEIKDSIKVIPLQVFGSNILTTVIALISLYFMLK